MKVEIDIDINNARKVLKLSCGSVEKEKVIGMMSDEMIKNEVLRHIKCYGITEVKGKEVTHRTPDIGLVFSV